MINAILPGTYVEVRAGETQSLQSTTGVVMMPLALDWGDKVTAIKKGDDTLYTLGYKIYDLKMKLVNEVMNYADQLIIYRRSESHGDACFWNYSHRPLRRYSRKRFVGHRRGQHRQLYHQNLFRHS